MAWDRTKMRMENAIRMELAGLPDSEIAARIGLVPTGLASMKHRQDYKELRDQIKDGLIADLDAETTESLKDLQTRIAGAVPLAITNLISDAVQQKDLKLRHQASLRIIEYDNRLVKPTKVELSGNMKMLKEDEDAVAEILAIQNPVQASVTP